MGTDFYVWGSGETSPSHERVAKNWLLASCQQTAHGYQSFDAAWLPCLLNEGHVLEALEAWANRNS